MDGRAFRISRRVCHSSVGVVLAFGGLLLIGCVDDLPRAPYLQSFRVVLSPGLDQPVGTEDEPLSFVSGVLCGATACADSTPCPDGEECIGYCEGSGSPCEVEEECGQWVACVKRCVALYHIDVEAVGSDGARYDYTGPVRLRVTPGLIPQSVEIQEMVEGRLERAPVYISSSSGRTNIWVEQDGFRWRAGAVGQCNDGVDNDGDGWIDMADPSCQSPDDDYEGSVTSATGIGPDLHFEDPDLRSVQWSPSITFSPLEGQNITVSRGDLIVTNVTNTGMYVTDLRYQRDILDDGQVGHFNSIFLYTWSTPDGVIQGDVLCQLSGGVVEFQGNTQMTFPSYEPFYPNVARCAALRARYGLPESAGRNDILDAMGVLATVTEPDGSTAFRADLDRLTVPVSHELVPAFRQLVDAEGDVYWRPLSSYTAFRNAIDENACILEPFESGLVEFEDVQVSTVFLECDQNQNGYIDDGDEWTCRDECQNDPLCTELQSFERYKQWAGLAAERVKIYVNQEMLLEHNPLPIASVGLPDESGRCTFESFWIGDTPFRRYVCPPMRFERIRGNLRQIYLCGKRFREWNCPLQLISVTPPGDRDMVPAEEP
jgi:hypothetical protein